MALFTRTSHGITLTPNCTASFITFQTPSSANYRSIFDSALEAYKKKTVKDLTSDPLLRRFETCHSPDDILVILREHISGFDRPQSSSNGLAKCLNPTVNVLHTFSTITIIGASPGPMSLGPVTQDSPISDNYFSAIFLYSCKPKYLGLSRVLRLARAQSLNSLSRWRTSLDDSKPISTSHGPPTWQIYL